MTPEFFWGAMTGCGLSMLIGFIWMALSKPKTNYTKERDPADWWKDT